MRFCDSRLTNMHLYTPMPQFHDTYCINCGWLFSMHSVNDGEALCDPDFEIKERARMGEFLDYAYMKYWRAYGARKI